MARFRPEQRCPCGAGRTYKRCCQPLHLGAPAPTAVALMRSRYAAYAGGLADYIIATTHPAGPRWEADRATWLAEIARFTESATFTRLSVRDSEERGDQATVTFEAHLRQGGQDGTMVEKSLFLRENGRWLYHSGERPRTP